MVKFTYSMVAIYFGFTFFFSQAMAAQGDITRISQASSTDASGIASYRIFRDGVAIAVTSNASFENGGLLPSENYNYSIVAVDLAGNESAPSAVETVSTIGLST